MPNVVAAQSSFLGFSLGSTWTSSDGRLASGINESNRTAVQMGIAYELPIWQGFSLGTGLHYDPKNLRYDNSINSFDQNPDRTVETRSTYRFLTLPLYFQAGWHEFNDWLGPSKNLFIEGGGFVSFLAHAFAENSGEAVNFTAEQNRFSGGLIAGMGLNIPLKDNLLKLGIRGMYLMSNELHYAPLVGGDDIKLTSLSAYLNYSWGL